MNGQLMNGIKSQWEWMSERENWSANGHKPYAVWELLRTIEERLPDWLSTHWLTDWPVSDRCHHCHHDGYSNMLGKWGTLLLLYLTLNIYLFFSPFSVSCVFNLLCYLPRSTSTIWCIQSECKLISSSSSQQRQPNEVTAPFYYSTI